VEEFRVRAVTADDDEFLVRGERLYALRADAESAVTTDRRRYRWPSAPAEPAYVIEARTVTRSPWAAVD
jgi:hypothetical protein